MGVVLNVLAASGNTAAVLQWSFLPGLVAPVLSGVGAGLFAGGTARAPWWYWVAVGAVVPVGAYVVTLAYFASHGVATPGLIGSSLIQVAVSAGFALGIGTVRRSLLEMAR